MCTVLYRPAAWCSNNFIAPIKGKSLMASFLGCTLKQFVWSICW